MKALLRSFKAYLKDESGQTSTEYILLIAVVAAVVYRFKGEMEGAMERIMGQVFGERIEEFLR